MQLRANSRLDDGARPDPLDLDDPALDVAAVRRWTRHALSGVTGDELEDVLLVVNELVSNAFDRGHSPRGMQLHRSAQPCLVRVEVDDASPNLPVLGSSRLGGHRGRGMLLVSRVTKDWGVTQGPHGKTVWAEITCEPQ